MTTKKNSKVNKLWQGIEDDFMAFALWEKSMNRAGWFQLVNGDWVFNRCLTREPFGACTCTLVTITADTAEQHYKKGTTPPPF